MATPIEALKAALYNDGQADNRKTFGTVEYALIPVYVIEDVIQYEPEDEQEAAKYLETITSFDTEGDSDQGDRDICVVPAVPTAVMGSEEEEEPITSFDRDDPSSTEGDSDQGDRDKCVIVIPPYTIAVPGSEEEEE